MKKKILAALSALTLGATMMAGAAMSASATCTTNGVCVKSGTPEACYGKGILYYSTNYDAENPDEATWSVMPHSSSFMANAVYDEEEDTVTLILQSMTQSGVVGRITSVSEDGTTISSNTTYNNSSTDANGYNYLTVDLDPKNNLDDTDTTYGVYTMNVLVDSPYHQMNSAMTVRFVIDACDCGEDCGC